MRFFCNEELHFIKISHWNYKKIISLANLQNALFSQSERNLRVNLNTMLRIFYSDPQSLSHWLSIPCLNLRATSPPSDPTLLSSFCSLRSSHTLCYGPWPCCLRIMPDFLLHPYPGSWNHYLPHEPCLDFTSFSVSSFGIHNWCHPIYCLIKCCFEFC